MIELSDIHMQVHGYTYCITQVHATEALAKHLVFRGISEKPIRRRAESRGTSCISLMAID